MARVQDYSPSELLQFGQRAEAEGNSDYALRVYAYLANNFPDTVEGEIGFDSYGRLEPSLDRGGQSEPVPDPLRSNDRAAHHDLRQQQSDEPASRPAAGSRQGHAPASAAVTDASRHVQYDTTPLIDRLAALRRHSAPPSSSSTATLPKTPVKFSWLQEVPTASANDRGALTKSEQSRETTQSRFPSADNDRDTILPRMIARALDESEGDLEESFQRRYRAGSAIAIMFAVMGWLMLACGLALIGVTLSGNFAELGAIGLTAIVPAGIEAAIGALFSGLVLVFASQVGSAILDNANATRHLLAIERAKAGY